MWSQQPRGAVLNLAPQGMKRYLCQCRNRDTSCQMRERESCYIVRGTFWSGVAGLSARSAQGGMADKPQHGIIKCLLPLLGVLGGRFSLRSTCMV